MGLTLFIERKVNRQYFVFIIPPQWAQNINTIIIIVGGPLLAHILVRLRKAGYAISIPLQFASALTLIGIAFMLLPVGIYFANSKGYVSFNWIIANYSLQSFAELLISPIGYAMIGQLAPQRMQGMMMGTWLMTSGIAATFSSRLSQMALGHHAPHASPLVTNYDYSHTFGTIGISSAICGLLLFALSPFLYRLISGKQSTHSA